MYYVYMLRCADNSIYTGTARDVSRRMNEHFNKSEKRAKYTKSHIAKKLEAVWECESKSSALKLEYRLKEMTKQEKELLIKENIAPQSICLKLQGEMFTRINVSEIEFQQCKP